MIFLIFSSINIKINFYIGTLQDGEEKLKKFHSAYNRKQLVFTEESDYTPEEKAKKIEEKFRHREENESTNLLKVNRINSDSSNSDFNESESEKNVPYLIKEKNKKPSVKIPDNSNKKKRKRYSSSDDSFENSDEKHYKKHQKSMSGSRLLKKKIVKKGKLLSTILKLIKFKFIFYLLHYF